MRVLYWSELFWPYIGGAEVFGAKLIPALQKRGYEFVVVTSHDYLDLPDEAQYRGVHIRRLPFRKAVTGGGVDLFFDTRRQVVALKQAFAPDLVYVNGITPSVLFHLQTAHAHPAPTLVRMNQEVLHREADKLDTLTGRVLREADWVACVSAAVLAQARRWMPDTIGHSSVIYTGLDVPALSPKPPPMRAPRLLCLGRLVPAKGFDVALNALASIVDRFPLARLIVAGDGSARPGLQRQAAELGLRQVVDFIGWVDPERVPTLLNSATMVLVPSRYEGLPVVAIQAALMARPIVATRVSGLPEVVVHGQTGLLIEKEDSSALAEAVVFLLEHPETAMQMGQAARRRAREVFSWQRSVAAYDALQRRLIRGRSDAESAEPTTS